MTLVILEFRAGSGLLPPQRRPLHQLVKPIAIEDYHRKLGCSDLLLFFRRSSEWSSASYAPRLQLAAVHLFKLRIFEKGTVLFFYYCPLLAENRLGRKSFLMSPVALD